MAKSKSGKNRASVPTQRYYQVSPIAESYLNYQAYARQQLAKTNTALLDVGDRRAYRPDKRTAPPHATRRSATRIHQTNIPRTVAFAVPARIALCARRAIRKQVLHAFKRTGRGSGRVKKHFNFWSRVKC